ncbi:CASP-like protein 1F1 [Magnolia sinica]|uniref:CASP-like protein 1F1 n=1 Tax=Magnolia sinica TaxID=86752 RepID=UPI00265A8637|nr:CASP-like protein 1F1 [Magnolia sinica]
MATNQIKMEQNPPQKTPKTLVLIQISLRFLAFAAAAAAALVMAMNKETTTVYGITVDAKYSYSPAFRFFVVGNAVASAYALLSIPFVIILCSKASSPSGYFFLFLFDQLVMLLVVAAASAATAVGYVGKKGNSHAGWAPICGYFEKYCDKAGGSLFCSFVALIVYLLLTVVSATKAREVPVSRY